MQTIKSYLYDNPIRVLIFGSDCISEEDRTVYSKGIKLYQGVVNQVKLNFLNQDQKTVDMTGYTVQANIFDVGGNQILVNKTADINANVNTNSIFQLTFSSNDLDALDLGYYDLALVTTDVNGAVETVYINDNYQVRLPMELMLGPLQGLSDPIELSFSNNNNNGYASQMVDVTDQMTLSSVYTFQYDLNEYTGNVLVQGAMVTSPNLDDFGNIDIQNFSNYSGPIMTTVSAQLTSLMMTLDNANVQIPANSYINSAQLRF